MNFKEKGVETIRKLPIDVFLNKSAIKSLKEYSKSGEQQDESLSEKRNIAHWLSLSLKNYSNNAYQQCNIPKIVPIEEDDKVSLRLDTGKKWLEFGEETFNLLLEVFYPGDENILKHKELKDLVFKEKREIVLKVTKS